MKKFESGDKLGISVKAYFRAVSKPYEYSSHESLKYKDIMGKSGSRTSRYWGTKGLKSKGERVEFD